MPYILLTIDRFDSDSSSEYSSAHSNCSSPDLIGIDPRIAQLAFAGVKTSNTSKQHRQQPDQKETAQRSAADAEQINRSSSSSHQEEDNQKVFRSSTKVSKTKCDTSLSSVHNNSNNRKSKELWDSNEALGRSFVSKQTDNNSMEKLQRKKHGKKPESPGYDNSCINHSNKADNPESSRTKPNTANQKHEGRLPTTTTNDSSCSPASELHNCITLKVSPPKPPRLSQSQENLTRCPMQTMAESQVEVAIYQTPSTVVMGSETHATIHEEATAQPYAIVDTSAFQKPGKTVTVSKSVSLFENFKQCFSRISVSH